MTAVSTSGAHVLAIKVAGPERSIVITGTWPKPGAVAVTGATTGIARGTRITPASGSFRYVKTGVRSTSAYEVYLHAAGVESNVVTIRP